jgi:pimeloyl-ACP methyl ester carboxylesterase
MVYDRASIPSTILKELVREARQRGAGVGDASYNHETIGPTRMRNDLLPDVFRITAPTLFLQGDNDNSWMQTSVAAAELMQRRSGAGRSCGHWVQLEAPDVFLTEVGPFLDRIR